MNLSQSDKSVESPQELKQRLSGELENKFKQSQSQAKESFQQKKWSLVKTAVKWSLGAVISGVMLIWIWVLTDWTRKVTLGLQEE